MTINSSTRIAGPYTGNGSTTAFPFSFKVFTTADVTVVRTNLSGVESTLTLGTDYTVSLNANQNSNPGGTVTMLTAPASGFLITLTSSLGYTQTLDLTNQGGFYPSVINDALDRATIQIQQLNEQVGRAAKVNISSGTDTTSLVNNINTLASNLSTVQAVNANQTNINAVSSNSSNINTVAGNNTNINTVAGMSGNITTVAGISSNVTTVAGIASNVTTVAGVSSAVTTNATNISSINTNASNITAIQNASTNATSAASSATAAASSATSASSSASTASTQASNASTSATNAAASATNAATSATAASNSAIAAAASAASGLYRQVLDKSANYTVTSSDGGTLFRVTTTGGVITITLPQISTITDGFKVSIVKWTGDANAVTVARSGSDTINGATSATIGAQYSQTTFVADYETNQWFAASSGLGTSNINVDVKSGDGSTVAFTLSGDPGSKNNTLVEISGVYQQKSTYSVSGTTLTFSTAPPTGTSNIEIVWSAPLAIGTPSDGTVTTAKIADANITLAKLSASGTASSSTFLRGDNSWATPPTSSAPTVQVFTSSGTYTKPAGLKSAWVRLVGGGGGGASCNTSNTTGDGGGGGGYSEKVIAAASIGTTETVTVGAGGAGGANFGGASSAGGTTSFGSHCSGTGGSGGANPRSSSGTAGGSGSSGNINISGGRSQRENGGASPLGAGGGPNLDDREGSNGSGYGAGGGSVANVNNGPTGRTGGNGSAGIVIVVEYY